MPIYIYDSDNGNLTPFNLNESERKDFLVKMCKEQQIKSSIVKFELDSDYTKENKSIDVINNNKDEQLMKERSSLSRQDFLEGLRYGKNFNINLQETKAPYKPTQINQNALNQLREKSKE